MPGTSSSSPSTFDPATPRLGTRRAATAVACQFGVNGSLLGAWGGVLPSLRAELDLDAGHIAAMLVIVGLFAITAMQVGGRLADRLGAHRVALAGLPVIMVGAIVAAASSHYVVLVTAAALIGLGNGAMDVGMNSLGVQVEQARPRPIMSFFHACFSIGTLAGAGLVVLVGFVAGAPVVPVVVGVLVTVGVIMLVVLIRITPPAAPVAHVVDGVRTRIPPAAYVLGIMAIAFGLAEGTAVDWSSIHVTDTARVPASTGAVGLVAVTASMTLVRLVGDRLVARFGRRAVVRCGGVLAAGGYAITAFTEPLPLLVLGWALVGFGVGLIAPQVYGVAGHMGGGRVMAVVVTFGYAAFLVGPGIMGVSVTHLGVAHAMIIPAVLSALLVALAVTLPTTDRDLRRAG